jgi:hypothetical protein
MSEDKSQVELAPTWHSISDITGCQLRAASCLLQKDGAYHNLAIKLPPRVVPLVGGVFFLANAPAISVI